MSISLGMLFFSCAVGLIAIGVVGLLLCDNLFRMVLALAVTEAGANLMLVMAGFRWDAVAPILQAGMDTTATQSMVDPVPQAMVLTAIVIGVGVQALALTLVVRIHGRYGTLKMSEARQRMFEDLDAEARVDSPQSQDKPAGKRPLHAPGPFPVQPREVSGD